MKIKIIDLLNKITNGESVPLKIKYDKVIWDYDKDSNDYYSDEWLFGDYLGRTTLNEFCNDEIEIIEEEKKIELPEKIAIIPFEVQASEANNFKQVGKALNQIIDYLKYKEEKEKKE